ncbi:sodium/potassium-transporting ATPase subunit beta-2-like [Venturia canescens]|uniref:sodium/potassium-transporting ATPase subunit beta-2-like n=1 Tax=Venturia canescens TaxID=32260 RepID=UPI001C9BE569|nr:sodium/potassium-transporting ATPase subunit beta-2-like [Venturia canescens]
MTVGNTQNEASQGQYKVDDYMRIPVEKTRWEAIRDVFYNPNEHTVLGRTNKQWGITGLFYLVFFSCLAVFCAMCYHGFMATLSYERPRWTLDSSLIGTNPGLGFRPLPRIPEARSLIWYNATNATQVDDWVSNIDEFLTHYRDSSKLPNGGRNQQVCSYEHQNVEPGNVCAVEVHQFGPCSPKTKYGFHNSSPCVFIKLNRIFGWIPDYYNNPNQLPEEMPQDLIARIKTYNSTWLNTIWISCKGADPFDRENIGPIKYFPEFFPQGLPGFYYPYENIPGYLSPLLAVQFERPKTHVIIAVECRAWAKNIQYDPYLKLGMVHFELLID